MRTRIFFIILLLVCGSFLMPGRGMSLDYPNREIELVAAFAPGSNTDLICRVVAKFAEKYVGKPIVVVNKAGGSGSKGYGAVGAAKPDGYTLGLIANATITQSYLLKGVTYHYKKSFRPVCQTDYAAQWLIVNKGGPFDIPLKDLIKKVNEKPDTIKTGIGGFWSTQDMTRIIFEDETGTSGKWVKVPFPGSAEAMPALLGGHVDVEIGPVSQWSSLYKSGKINVIAASIEKRDPRFPDIPTFKELGYNVVHAIIHWVAAPAGTPDPVVNFLSEAFKKAFNEPAYIEAMDKLGGTAAWEGPEVSAKIIDSQGQLYEKIIKKYDLKPQ